MKIAAFLINEIVTNGQISNMTELVLSLALHRPDDKPLFDFMLVNFSFKGNMVAWHWLMWLNDMKTLKLENPAAQLGSM